MPFSAGYGAIPPSRSYEHCLKYEGIHIKPAVISNILIAEYVLREATQREAAFCDKLEKLQDNFPSDCEQCEIQDLTKERDVSRISLHCKEQRLYYAVSMLPQILKNDYDSLRKVQGWYLRRTLANDCKEQSGCCARGCRCCEKRRSVRGGKGAGHCTLECPCCITYRGVEFSETQKEELRVERTQKLQDSNISFLIRLGNDFFLQLGQSDMFVINRIREAERPPTYQEIVKHEKSSKEEISSVKELQEGEDLESQKRHKDRKRAEERSMWKRIFGSR